MATFSIPADCTTFVRLRSYHRVIAVGSPPPRLSHFALSSHVLPDIRFSNARSSPYALFTLASFLLHAVAIPPPRLSPRRVIDSLSRRAIFHRATIAYQAAVDL